MIGNPLTFKGLLPKPFVSDQTFKRFLLKIQDLRKVSSSTLQYLLLVHKGIQFLDTYLVKQSESLQTCINNDMNDDKRYHNQLGLIFQTTGSHFQHFDNTLETNMKQYHLQTSIEIDELTTVHMDDLMNLYKKYKQLDESIYESAKKWVKSQKQLSECIKVYKDSFDDPKLIYNKEQIGKRYTGCETTYHNAVKEEVNLMEKTKKLYECKNSYIEYYNRFLTQYSQSYEFISEKVLMEAKKVIELYCDMHRLIVSDLATKRVLLSETKIKCFLYIVPDMSHQKQCFNITSNFISEGKFPIFLENPESIKDAHLKVFPKWLFQYGQFLRDCSDNNKKLMKRVHLFIYDLMRTIEKVAQFLVKEVNACFQKIKKKIIEVFGTRTVEYIQCINQTLQISMRVYQKLVKRCWPRLQLISNTISQDNKMIQLFFKQYYKQLQLFNQQTKLLDIIHHKKQIRSSISQKSQIIKYCLNSFGEKLNKTNQIIKLEINGIVNEMFSILNQVFVCSSEYQLLYFDSEFIEKVGKIKGDCEGFCGTLGERIGEREKEEGVVVVDGDRFRYGEFVKIKKGEGEGRQSIKKKESMEIKQEISPRKQSCIQNPKRPSNPQSPRPHSSLDPKQHKNYQFLRSKIQFLPNQTFLHTFSCALHDKILLQGKLYLTSQRLCFHSYFNATTLFFGGTLLQIPRSDVVKVEKRMYGKIFDNSIGVKTVNGEVFFTSFYGRDEVIKRIWEAFGMKGEEEEEKVGEQMEGEDGNEKENQPEDGTQLEGQQPHQPQLLTSPDDITPSELQSRLQLLNQAITNPKLQKLSSNFIKNVNCLYLLNRFFSSEGFTYDNVKHSSFFAYLKQQFGEKQIQVSSWQPSIESYLNKNNMKSTTPLHFHRKASFNHTLPKSSIPFMPKFCGTLQQDRLTIISPDKFLIDFKVISQGVPYADTFVCYTREEYVNTGKGVEVIGHLWMDYIKKSMFQGVIQKQAVKDLTESQETYVKLMNKIIGKDGVKKGKVVKKREGQKIKEEGVQEVGEGKGEEEVEEEREEEEVKMVAEKKYTQLLEDHEKLQKNYTYLKFIILSLVILNILQIIL